MLLIRSKKDLNHQMNIVGPQVRQLREKRNMTQEAFAELCNEEGWDISRGTLAKVEAQVRRVTDEEVVWLAEILNTEVGDLFPD